MCSIFHVYTVFLVFVVCKLPKFLCVVNDQHKKMTRKRSRFWLNGLVKENLQETVGFFDWNFGASNGKIQQIHPSRSMIEKPIILPLPSGNLLQFAIEMTIEIVYFPMQNDSYVKLPEGKSTISYYLLYGKIPVKPININIRQGKSLRWC